MANDVAQGRDLHPMTGDLKELGLGRKAVVAARVRGRSERDVEVAAARRHVDDAHRCEQRGVRIETHALRFAADPQPCVEIAQRCREALKVLWVWRGNDVGVVRHRSGAMQHCGQPPDQHVGDVVPGEMLKDAGGIKRLRHGANRRGEPKRAPDLRLRPRPAAALASWPAVVESELGRRHRVRRAS